MRKKIKNSLSVKVFLWVFSALTICSMLIYGIVLTSLPRQYQVTSDQQLEDNTKTLVSQLQDMHYEAALQEIYNFCIQNNSAALLSDPQETVSFGEIKNEDMAKPTAATANIVTTVTFKDSKTEYTLVISSRSQTADILLNLMLHFLPAVLAIILLLSFLSALICSRIIVTPIAEISRISQRMTSYDITWKCDIKSNDEIGVLASSLNTMAGRLQKTMEELKNANQQLTDDIETFRAMEHQRKNFFAAVSHELKTPLTILKGQLENMILGYGDYQNHEKYLPEALKAAETIENLVKEIITITKMEHMDLQNSLQEVSLIDSVNDTIQTILPLAQEKGIQIHQRIRTDTMLSVHPNLWHKVLSNIIGNAVRHSPCGEHVFITRHPAACASDADYGISPKPCADKTVLAIENTGARIPEEDLFHLFTPFYRTDKSRSKATGGSGLGLYIVKTILDLHNMTCCIQNTKKGVIFFLYLNE